MKFGIYGFQHSHIAIFIEEMLALGHRCVGIYEPGCDTLAADYARAKGLALLSAAAELEASDVEIVGSAAINGDKIAVVRWCERHRKHVMLDKPPVTDRTAEAELQAIMERGQIQVGLLLTERFNPAIFTMRERIGAGEIGELVSIQMRKPHRLSAARRPDWFFSRAQSGGILIDLLIHDYDLLRWLTGSEIAETHSYMGKKMLSQHPDFYDSVSSTVRMDDGVVAQLYADWHTPDASWTWGDGRIFATGTAGVLEARLSGLGEDSREQVLYLGTHRREREALRLRQPACSITADFLNRIAGRPACIAHRDIALAVEASLTADERAVFVNAYASAAPAAPPAQRP